MTTVAPSETLRARLAAGGPIVVLTGAGVSAESGLATFRGPDGLWAGRDPMSLATPQAFHADPDLVWRFYAWRRAQARGARPNPGHLALAALERARPGLVLVTQNVDGLHERAGSGNVVRLHGSLWRLRCLGEDREFDDERDDLGPLPARCTCGALLRPGVVWFGESLPPDALARAEAAARGASVMIVAGTSSVVYPAAALPSLARAAGAWIVEVNPQPTAISGAVDERLEGPAGVVLPALARAAGAAMEPA